MANEAAKPKKPHLKITITDMRPSVKVTGGKAMVHGQGIEGEISIRMYPPVTMIGGDSLKISDRNGYLCTIECEEIEP